MLWLFRFRVSGFVAVTVMGCSGKAPCSVIHVSGRGVGFGAWFGILHAGPTVQLEGCQLIINGSTLKPEPSTIQPVCTNGHLAGRLQD